MSKKLLIVGTHGVPARYGGFETMVEQLSPHLEGYKVGVVCSSKGGKAKPESYRGLRLHHLPISASGYASPFYDAFSMIIGVLRRYDLILYLGPSFGLSMIIPWLFGIPVVVNFGGLDEWSRPKYPFAIRKLIWLNYYLATKLAKTRIADNEVVRSSVEENFGHSSAVIRYGGDHVLTFEKREAILSDLPREYALVVARAQADTLLEEIICAWEKKALPLVIISNWSVSNYGLMARELGNAKDNVVVLDAIYDQDLLNTIRSHSKIYLHTHTLCGTSPSLVEAINLELPIFSVDALTNRETTDGGAHYWKTASELVEFLLSASFNEQYVAKLVGVSQRLKKKYAWPAIAKSYVDVFDEIL